MKKESINGLKKKWYALFVKEKYKLKIVKALAERKIESYVPHRNAIGDRNSKAKTLFSDFVFVKCDILKKRRNLSAIEGIISIVGDPFPESIPDKEINSLKNMIASGIEYNSKNSISLIKDLELLEHQN
ncbi:MAG: hypothetical protein A2Y62_01670 [Candidatus Fischerbacteria bacterium RBG_13_37_8]|uniref:NusG-like N-terminal domain-containing protein n=1 Tax=Candidatus Fischerbacteria bacterium RBG_13_37_8 TaxID=1817863 RepID=A0A1F5VDT8_9BACT|nr:MAG: hypothetical protein A2Y62_01670 [Candidatus Fischerbacteria bacterium RBG_13_37_8]